MVGHAVNMPAGKLNRKFRVTKQPATTDENNQPVGPWEFVRYVWVRALTETGMGAIRGSEPGVPLSPVRYSFRARYPANLIDNGMRMEYGDQIFEILQLRHDHAGHKWTDIVCVEGANNG